MAEYGDYMNGRMHTLIIRLILPHTIPMFTTFVNAYITRLKMSTKLARLVLPISSAYFYMNYKQTKKLGHPVYPFLTWENELEGVGICAVLIGAIFVFYFSLCFLDSIMKVRYFDKKQDQKAVGKKTK